MMTEINKVDFVNIADRIGELEDQKKESGELIKEAVEKGAESLGVNKKVLKKAVKEYLKYKEDQGAYLVEKLEIDSILTKILPIG